MKIEYTTPGTKIIRISFTSSLLYNSGDYGQAGGNPTEDEETVL